MTKMEPMVVSPEPSSPILPPSVPVVRIPKYIDLLPDQLAIRVFTHEVQVGAQLLPCWSYVTDGLRHLDQKEVILTLTRRPAEGDRDFPEDPLSFFTDLYGIARRGKSFGAGSFTRILLRKPFFGFTDQVGFAYVPPVPLKGVHWPSPPLSVVFLHPEEIKAVSRIGTYRVLSLLGQSSRHFPHPFWSDRDRATVLHSAELEKSLLSRVPVISIPTASLARHSNLPLIDTFEHPRYGKVIPENSPLGHWLTLRLDEASVSRLQTALTTLPPEAPLAILTTPADKSNARLVWKADTNKTQTITRTASDQSVLTGGFMLFLADDGFREGAALVEDGFVLRLSRDHWASLRLAIQAGHSWMIPSSGPGTIGFVLEWDWPGKARFRSGMAYQTEDELRERLTQPAAWCEFIRQVDAAIVAEIDSQRSRSGCPMIASMIVRPGGECSWWIEGVSSDLVGPLKARLSGLTIPEVGGAIAYTMLYHLWDGPMDDDEKCAYIPDEWMRPVSASGGVNDAAIALILK